MHGVAAFHGRPQAVALHGLQQQHAGLAGNFLGLLEGRVDLLVIVAAALDGADLLVGQGAHQLFERRVVLHPVLAHHVARRDGVHLVVAVHGLFHARLQDAVHVAFEQDVPAAAPDHLDDVPVRAAKGAFEFLDDLAVAAHRAVEALQVAIHHQDHVVQLFPGGDVDGAEHFRLVGFAVADEGPNLAAVFRLEPPMLQVLDETRLVDGAWRGQPHAGAGHLPEPRQAARMRIGRQAAAGAEFAAEVGELDLGEAPLQEGARVHARRGVGLEVHLVAAVAVAGRAEDVVEAHFHHGGSREVGGDVAADARAAVVRLQHHRRGVPAQDVLDTGFQVDVARIGGLLGERNGVLVGRVEGRVRKHHAVLRKLALQARQQRFGALAATLVEHAGKRFDPLPLLLLPIRGSVFHFHRVRGCQISSSVLPLAFG